LTPSLADSSSAYQLAMLTNREKEESDKYHQFEEITVTALRFNPTLREAPASVTIIGKNEIALRGSNSLAGAITRVPGIHIKDIQTVVITGFTVSATQ